MTFALWLWFLAAAVGMGAASTLLSLARHRAELLEELGREDALAALGGTKRRLRVHCLECAHSFTGDKGLGCYRNPGTSGYKLCGDINPDHDCPDYEAEA